MPSTSRTARIPSTNGSFDFFFAGAEALAGTGAVAAATAALIGSGRLAANGGGANEAIVS
jgi:hypothetical protein